VPRLNKNRPEQNCAQKHAKTCKNKQKKIGDFDIKTHKNTVKFVKNRQKIGKEKHQKSTNQRKKKYEFRKLTRQKKKKSKKMGQNR
jgi:hypothetical protein